MVSLQRQTCNVETPQAEEQPVNESMSIKKCCKCLKSTEVRLTHEKDEYLLIFGRTKEVNMSSHSAR